MVGHGFAGTIKALFRVDSKPCFNARGFLPRHLDFFSLVEVTAILDRFAAMGRVPT